MASIHKKLYFFLMCLNFSHIRSTLHLMEYTYHFFPLLSFWTCQFWCFSVLLLCSVSLLPHQQNVSLWGLFHQGGKEEKVVQGQIWWIRRVRHGGHAILGQKQLNTQCRVWAGALVNHPPWNGQMCWVFKKKFTETKHSLSQQCQLVLWYKWVPGILT